MIEGTCLCGAVGWSLAAVPERATACNCTACRRYGTLWAYGWEGEDIRLSGRTTAYVRGGSLSFNFCPVCGNASHWRSLAVDAQGRRRVAINLRLADPRAVEAVPLRHFDGLDSWTSVPGRARCVAELWF